MKRTQGVTAASWAAAMIALGAAGMFLQPLRAQSIATGANNSVTDDNATPPRPGCNRADNANGTGDAEKSNTDRPLPPGPPPSPEEIMVGQLDLSAEQQAQVQAIFDGEREQMRALHEQTQQLLASVLTEEQRQQLSQMKPPPPPPPPGGPQSQNSNGQARNQSASTPSKPPQTSNQ